MEFPTDKETLKGEAFAQEVATKTSKVLQKAGEISPVPAPAYTIERFKELRGATFCGVNSEIAAFLAWKMGGEGYVYSVGPILLRHGVPPERMADHVFAVIVKDKEPFLYDSTFMQHIDPETGDLVVKDSYYSGFRKGAESISEAKQLIDELSEKHYTRLTRDTFRQYLQLLSDIQIDSEANLLETLKKEEPEWPYFYEEKGGYWWGPVDARDLEKAYLTVQERS